MDKYKDFHTERSKSEKDKCYMISLICEIKKKKVQTNLSIKQK